MRLEHLQKDLLRMTSEEVLDRVRRIREGRVLPIRSGETKVKKREVSAKNDLKKMLDSMEPDERAKFIEDMGKGS